MRDELAETIFRESPLDLTIPIPDRIFWALVDVDCTCKATPEMMHAQWCAIYGIFAEVCEDLQIWPRGLFNQSGDPIWFQMAWRWVCSGVSSWHVGGEVNGPRHWCEREGKVVNDDD